MNKLVRKQKNNNKGFSLVELIVVIAIMAVLVGVIAPQFLGYVEKSRRSADITNAQVIASAVQADVADGVIIADSSSEAIKGNPTAVTATPVVKNTTTTGAFWYSVDASNSVSVGIGSSAIDMVVLYPTVSGSF